MVTWNEFCKIKTSAECSLHNTAIISLKWGLSHYQFDDWCEWSYLTLVSWKEVIHFLFWSQEGRKAGLCRPSCLSFQGHSPHSFTIFWIQDLLYRGQNLFQDYQRKASQVLSSKGSQGSFPWSFQAASLKREAGRRHLPAQGEATQPKTSPVLPAQLCLTGAPGKLVSTAGAGQDGHCVCARWRRALRKGWFQV